jgi:hypothetical protein
LIGADDKQKPPFATGDLDRGETVRVRFPDGGRATVKLRDIWETRDSPRDAPRRADVTVARTKKGSGVSRLPTP